MAEPIADILVLTRNHQSFIGNCVLSVLNQQCSYPYRITVLDDASGDNTWDVLSKLKSDYPSSLGIIRNEFQLGIMESSRVLSRYANAKYICFFDGDDYWNYPLKLQTQIEFLENNPQYSGCFHDAAVHHIALNSDKEYLNRTQGGWKSYSQFNRYYPDFMPWALVERNILPTASLLFRKIDLTSFLDNYQLAPLSLSWALHLEIIKGGKFRYFNEIWSTYNDHPAGVSKQHEISEFKTNNIKILQSLLTQTEWAYYKAEIYSTICKETRAILKSHAILNKNKREYMTMISQYAKHLKLARKAELEQLKTDYQNHVRNNRLVE
ncbi:MAG TPA: glycosyltransferase family A protein [Bacteroidales bacterium]|nr:glycosyltransferase family A protein [Bacteroidales bacterium]